jgi:membrane fusion protein, multidrug efflux system
MTQFHTNLIRYFKSIITLPTWYFPEPISGVILFEQLRRLILPPRFALMMKMNAAIDAREPEALPDGARRARARRTDAPLRFRACRAGAGEARDYVCAAFSMGRERRKTRGRFFWNALGALAMAAVLAGCGKPAPKAEQKFVIQTARVQSAEGLKIGGEAAYIGMVRAEDETDYSFKVGGIIDFIGPEPGSDWKEGSQVKAGAPLAGLKQSDFVNALNAAKAQAELARKQLERFRALRAKDAVSQQELDSAQANSESTQARLRQAEQDLKDSQLRAPLDGVVLARYANSGQTVAPGRPALRFASTRRMQVEAGIPDRLVSYFTPGKEVGVEISGLEGHPPFPGRVSEVGVAASQEGRLFRVVIKLDNPDGLLRSGMTATVRAGDRAEFPAGSTLVPLSALVACPPEGRGGDAPADQLAVFVVKDGKASRRLIKTGDIVKNSIIVTEGLRAGEEAATGGASFLYDGQPVEVFQNAASTAP